MINIRCIYVPLLLLCFTLYATASSKKNDKDDSTITFLAVGDWGGQKDKPYYTAGQRDSADAMEEIAAKINAQFVLAVGDNFYPDGLDSVDSIRFEETFENVYTGAHLQRDWYACAGNHDYRGNVTAQIEYSEISARWIFPALYHAHHLKSEDGLLSIDLIMIDTVDLAGHYDLDEEDPGYFDPLPVRSRNLDEYTQWDWIEEQLSNSTADQRIVVGHYPVYSGCGHGSMETLVQHLRPLLIQYNAHYIAGHDHCMQYMKEGGVEYFQTGMGAECCYHYSQPESMPEGVMQWYISSNNADSSITAGFTSFTVTASSIVATYHDQDGNELFKSTDPIPEKPTIPMLLLALLCVLVIGAFIVRVSKPKAASADEENNNESKVVPFGSLNRNKESGDVQAVCATKTKASATTTATSAGIIDATVFPVDPTDELAITDCCSVTELDAEDHSELELHCNSAIDA